MLQNGTNVMFLTCCTTSIFEKRENVTIICFVTHEMQNCCSLTHDETPPPLTPLIKELLKKELSFEWSQHRIFS